MSSTASDTAAPSDAQRARESLVRATATAVEAERDQFGRDGLRAVADTHVRIAEVHARLDGNGAAL